MNSFKFLLKIWAIIEKRIAENVLVKLKHIYFKIRSLFYFGKKFYCPICNFHSRKLLPFGNQSNIACPKDDSLDRHRVIWLYLKFKTNFFSENLSVLHFAPEYCLYNKFQSMNSIEYITADLNSPEAMLKMDITNILFSDNIFDVFLCNQVLEHVVDDRKAMKELFRVLKPGGWGIINCPVDLTRSKTYENNQVTDPKIRKRLFKHEDHVRIYGKDIKERLEKAGFIVKRADYYLKHLNKKTIDKLALNPHVILYLCKKPKFNLNT